MKSSYNKLAALTLLPIISILLLSTFISTRSLQLIHVVINERKNTTELSDVHIKQHEKHTANDNNNDDDKIMNNTLPSIHFAIYGFPKTGTTTLLMRKEASGNIHAVVRVLSTTSERW